MKLVTSIGSVVVSLTGPLRRYLYSVVVVMEENQDYSVGESRPVKILRNPSVFTFYLVHTYITGCT